MMCSIFIYLALFAYEEYTNYVPKRPIDIEEKSEPCLWKTIQPGDSISEGSAGTYEYSLIITSHGIDVYRDCNDLK